MEIVRSVAGMKAWSSSAAGAGDVIGFVPTMGCLHEGHTSLVGIARELADLVVVSIFVNPTQFGPSEDLDRYPRDLERDAALAEEAGADVIFVPSVDEIYPDGFQTSVCVREMTRKMCGAFRPRHFDGVCTVVAKLLNIVRPAIAVFGQKDAQQAAVLERMVADLDTDVEIVRGPIVRERDGLAMSSRNVYLADRERADALVLRESLLHAMSLYERGERDASSVIETMRALIESKSSTRVQYIAAVDARTLEDVGTLHAGAMLALAVFVGATRLIDNIVLGEGEGSLADG